MEVSEHYVPCETVVGITAGRDAIYLDGVHYTPSELRLTLQGDLTGSLCSQNEDGAAWIAYKLTFLGVLAFRYRYAYWWVGAHRSINACNWRERRPGRRGGSQRGGGTR
jgi:hypothetical protein